MAGWFRAAVKSLLLITTLVASASTVLAQGTINFVNRITGTLDAPVSIGSWNGPLGRATGGGTTPETMMVAQLVAGPVGGPLAPVGDPIPFRSGVGEGYWIGASRTIPGVPENGVAQARVVVWSTFVAPTFAQAEASGLGGIGMSQTLTITTGGGLNPPAPLLGLEGFQAFFVPEPATPALALLGGTFIALLGRSRRPH
jgi:hypothetical protein